MGKKRIDVIMEKYRKAREDGLAAGAPMDSISWDISLSKRDRKIYENHIVKGIKKAIREITRREVARKKPKPIKEFHGVLHNGPYQITFHQKKRNKLYGQIGQVDVFVHVSSEKENLIEVARKAMQLSEKNWVAHFVHNVG